MTIPLLYITLVRALFAVISFDVMYFGASVSITRIIYIPGSGSTSYPNLPLKQLKNTIPDLPIVRRNLIEAGVTGRRLNLGLSAWGKVASARGGVYM